jgi:hypothetical protein
MNYRCLAMILATIFSLIVYGPHDLMADRRTCYPAAQDADGDGYADSNASAVEISVSQVQKLSCPDGYVRQGGDLEDSAAAIHPRRPEVPYDNIDNNSNSSDKDSHDKIDDPGFIYPFDNRNRWVTPTSFKIKLKINDRQTRDLQRTGRQIDAAVEVVRLAESGALRNESLSHSDILWENEGGHLYATLTVTGVQNTVYRAKVQFIERGASTNLGPQSDWYYTSTTGSNEEDKRRTGILLRGFHELNESNLGRVGYLGKPYVDGTKYGARPTEQWCSEFYSWVARPFIRGVSNETSVPQLVRFFKVRKAYIGQSEIAAKAASDDCRGDYLALHEEKTKIRGHSAMYLAYDIRDAGDATQNRIWTLEGNYTDSVKIHQRPLDELSGLGHVAYKQLQCQEWCDQNPNCVKCTTNRACGVGFERLKSWTGRGVNWHACAEKSRSAENHSACEQWCAENSPCVKCDTNRACGVGYERLKSWTGSGTNWHACAEKSRSAANHRACEQWCATRDECVKCDTNRACGVGFRRLKSWTGKGTNWHACAAYGHRQDYQAECEQWCASDPRCVKCDTNRACGVGFERLKSWTGPGKNWHACAEKSRSASNHSACEQWCAENSSCVKCDTNRACGRGYKRLKSWTGKGTNWHACRKSSSRDHRIECEQWCASDPRCVKCDTNRACGVGYERLKSWTGEGANWHACAEKSRSVDNHRACQNWCAARSQCVKCDTNRACGVGYERLKSWTGAGTNWHACAEKSRSAANHRACQDWCAANDECVKCDTNRACGRGYKRLKSWTGKGTNWHACKRR